MKHTEGTFKGVKGLKIFYQAWIPHIPKAVVLFLHGITEHSGRFPYLVEVLVANNYAMYADDHRGHGKSEGKRVHVESFDDYVEDERRLLDIITEKHPNLPIIMVGYSLGAAITFAFARKYQDQNLLQGIVLVGIPSSVKISIFLRFLAKFLSILRPGMRYGDVEYTLFSRDPKLAESYENDPLVFKEKYTVGLGHGIVKIANGMQKNASELTLPVLIQCGSADRMYEIFNARIDESEFDSILTMVKDKAIKIYDGLYHEIYNELEEDRKIVLKDLMEWLDNHIK